METIEAYKTSDGKIFDDKTAAENHELDMEFKKGLQKIVLSVDNIDDFETIFDFIVDNKDELQAIFKDYDLIERNHHLHDELMTTVNLKNKYEQLLDDIEDYVNQCSKELDLPDKITSNISANISDFYVNKMFHHILSILAKTKDD